MNEVDHSIQYFDAGGIRWRVASDAFDRVREWILSSFIDVAEDAGTVLKDAPGSRVGMADGVVLKERSLREGRSVFRFGLRPSRSRRAFQLGRELLEVGVPTPLPLAWATVRYGGLRVRDYLLTEYVGPCRVLTEILEERPDQETRLTWVRRLGGLLADCHRHGYSNRDLKDANVLVSRENSDKLWVVDLDGVRRGRVSRDRAARDLWPIVRSLRIYGWDDEPERSALLSAYNAAMPEMSRLLALPVRGAGVVAPETPTRPEGQRE